MKIPLQWGCMECLIHFVEISFVRVVFFLYDRERNQTNPGLSFLVSRVIVMDFRVSNITIRIDALSISVSVQLSHLRYHISSTLSRGQSISWDHQAVSWCGTYATVPIRFLGAQGCLLEENWDVYAPLQGIDERLRLFWALIHYEEQTDLDTESRATDHPQELRELHQKTQLILFWF